MQLDQENAELERMAESLWLTDKFVDYPKTIIGIGVAIVVGFSVVCFLLESYWPNMLTNRDILEYSDINTQLFDAREAAISEIQEKSTPSGEISLRSISKQDWWLNIGVECIKKDCENILTPEGIELLIKIDELIENDPLWPSVCLRASDTDPSCANDIMNMNIAKTSPVPIFKAAYGEDLSELTQFAIDFALFGLAYDETLFEMAIPLFSKGFNRNNRKAKMTRFLIMNAGPVDIDGIRYKNMGDRQPDQEYLVAQW